MSRNASAEHMSALHLNAAFAARCRHLSHAFSRECVLSVMDVCLFVSIL